MKYEFQYKNDILHCEDCGIPELADEYGTPLYIYSQNHFMNRLKEFQTVLEPVDHLVCFALKCNSNLAILNKMANAGSGFDIVSGGELRRVIESGADPSKVVFAGVGKTRDEQELAVDHGIKMFNVESVPEMKQLNSVARERNQSVDVALRINPDVDAKTHEKISTGKKENKFGLPIALIDEYVNEVEELNYLNLDGLHFHIGSQITTLNPFREVVDKACSLIDDLKSKGVSINTLNLGGGIGIQYKNETTIEPADWADVVIPKIQERDLSLIVEPGRFLMGNAGVLVTEVTYVKKSVTKNFIVVDGGMNDLIRPAMYDSYHEITPAIRNQSDTITADVVGPVCETGDFFGKDRDIEEPDQGDYLAVMSAGAYGFVMSSQYNSFPRPAEVLVNGRTSSIIREREEYDDLWSGEQILS